MQSLERRSSSPIFLASRNLGLNNVELDRTSEGFRNLSKNASVIRIGKKTNAADAKPVKPRAKRLGEFIQQCIQPLGSRARKIFTCGR